MLDQQIEVLNCEDKWAAIRGGVGSSKTFSLCYDTWAGLEEYPRAAHFVIGADYEQLRRGFFVTFVSILEKHGLEAGTDYVYRDSPSPMVTFKHNGARLRSLSAVLAERIRSIEIQRMVLEEPQTWNNGEEVYRILGSRLRHSPRSAALYPTMPLRGRMSFNPPSKSHWLYDLIENRWAKEGYKCWRFSLRDNVLLLGLDEYVHDREVNLPEELWPSEIDGHWRDLGGGVYYAFSRARHCQNVSGLPEIGWDIRPEKPIFWTLDFNVAWMASLLGQVHIQPTVTKGIHQPGPYDQFVRKIMGPQVDGWMRRVIYVLHEIFLPNAGTPNVVDAFVAYYRQLTGSQYGRIPVYVYGDPAGGARSQQMSSLSAARTNWQIIGAGLRVAGIPFVWKVMSAAPSVMDRVNATNFQLRTGETFGGTRGMLIDERECKNLIVDLEEVQWSKKIENQIDKSDTSETGKKRSHLTDALGYFVHVDRAESNGQKLNFPDWMAR